MSSVTDLSASQPMMTAQAGRVDGTGRRWVQVGHSWHPVARTAGRDATLAALRATDPRLLIVFASFEYDLTDLLAGVNSAAGQVPVIGCSSTHEIGPGPTLSRGVVVVCLGGEFAVTTAHASGLNSRPRVVGESVASSLLPLAKARYRIALMLTDTLAGDQQEMIRGAYGVLGATIPIVGGGAGDNMRMLTSRQLHNSEILQDSVVAALIGTDGPIGLSVRHGWHGHGNQLMITESRGDRIFTLDDRPALDIYLASHNAPPGLEMDPAQFTAFALTRPIALSRRGDVAVRQVLEADPKTRSIGCAGAVPRGSTVWLAIGDAASTLSATEAACADATRQLLDQPPLAMLLFNCACRRAVLGDQGVLREREYMHHWANGAPTCGFYTYGEIARTRGVNAYHNQTVVAVALS